MSDLDLLDVGFRWVECINHKDIEGLEQLATDDHVFVDLEGNVQELGREGIREAWEQYFELAPRYLIHLEKVYPQGDHVVMIGRTTGSHLDLPYPEDFREKLMFIAKVRHGQVAEWRLEYDKPESRRNHAVPQE